MPTIASAPMAFRLGLCLQQSVLSSLETSWEVPAQCPETSPSPSCQVSSEWSRHVSITPHATPTLPLHPNTYNPISLIFASLTGTVLGQ